MLDLIQQRWPSFSPRSASIDFEQGFANAMRAKHPQCNLHFSFFHLSQNLKKQLTEQGLIQVFFVFPNFIKFLNKSFKFVILVTMNILIF